MAFVFGTPLAETLQGTDLFDFIFAGGGNDTIAAGGGDDIVLAGAGNDIASGGDGNDFLFGGSGNDIVIGDRGDDFMFGGLGNDRLVWNNGDGSDVMVGGSGYDVAEVNGSRNSGDQFVLGKLGATAVFDRINLVPFSLFVSETETFEVNGLGGDDSFKVGDLRGTNVSLVKFTGGEGNDIFDGRDAFTALIAEGGVGNDLLQGGAAKDTLFGGDGIDTMSGGAQADRFLYAGNLFANGTPGGAGPIKFLATPDIITDFTVGEDQFAFKGEDIGLSSLTFQKGVSGDIHANGNVLVLLDGFANAGAAAQAIANNNNITADAGFFVYFNTTLGISRLVHSQDLGDGGPISILANLTNQAGDFGKANLNNFSAKEFVLV